MTKGVEPTDLQPLYEQPGVRAALARDASLHGYLFFRRLVEPALIAELREAVFDVCRSFGWTDDAASADRLVLRPALCLAAYDGPWMELQAALHDHPSFARLERHPAILAVLRALLCAEVVPASSRTCRVISPRMPGITTPPHQDYFYYPGAQAFWTVWIPLCDVPLHVGGLALVARSHRWPLLEHAQLGEYANAAKVPAGAAWSSAHYREGDVLMFDCLAVHRGNENISTSTRISVDQRYTAAPEPGDALAVTEGRS